MHAQAASSYSSAASHDVSARGELKRIGAPLNFPTNFKRQKASSNEVAPNHAFVVAAPARFLNGSPYASSTTSASELDFLRTKYAELQAKYVSLEFCNKQLEEQMSPFASSPSDDLNFTNEQQAQRIAELEAVVAGDQQHRTELETMLVDKQNEIQMLRAEIQAQKQQRQNFHSAVLNKLSASLHNMRH
jgi:hypothetical protein